MAEAREAHTATLLPDGRVLVVGGIEGVVTPLATAEIYDPKAGTFSPTGSMATARHGHTATLLPDGRVLVVGGIEGVVTSLATAEIYDPRTGTFSPTGSMAEARNGHTATPLPDGRVLVVGGWNQPGSGPQVHATAEIYEPRTGTFSPTGAMATGRVGHTATLLPDGRVLVAGGADQPGSGPQVYATAEIYDPKTGTFSPTGSMTTARGDHTATLLPDGRVLVAGGWDLSEGGEQVHATAEIYDPRTGTFSLTGSMAEARVGHTATLLPDGRVLVAGGADQTESGSHVHATAEIYDAKTGAFSPTGSMTTARSDHTATLLPDGRVLVAGGDTGSKTVASAEVYDPSMAART